ILGTPLPEMGGVNQFVPPQAEPRPAAGYSSPAAFRLVHTSIRAARPARTRSTRSAPTGRATQRPERHLVRPGSPARKPKRLGSLQLLDMASALAQVIGLTVRDE
ncbi:hypothetical protein ACWFRN_25195, partial [Streptomyces celluloflavus]